MSLSREQATFSSHVALTVLWANNGVLHPGHRLKIKEIGRTAYQQAKYVEDGSSWTMKSDHLEDLAADLYLYVDGAVQYSGSSYLHIGVFFVGLDPMFNYWGQQQWGKDAHHIGRKHVSSLRWPDMLKEEIAS